VQANLSALLSFSGIFFLSVLAQTRSASHLFALITNYLETVHKLLRVVVVHSVGL
jgi:hypothetical protein